MQVDWLTVAAQIANFLILIWLLRRFLYGPILRTMQAREAGIAARLEEAAQAGRAVDAREADLRARLDDLDASAQDLRDAARAEAAALRDRLFAETRSEIEATRTAGLAGLEAERARSASELRRRLAAEVYALARQVVTEFADTDLASATGGRFADHLGAMGENDRRRLTEAAARAGAEAQVESASELPAPTRATITRAIHEGIRPDLGVSYGTDPTLLLGLRLRVGNQSLEWSARRWLDQVETVVNEALRAEASGTGAPDVTASPPAREAGHVA